MRRLYKILIPFCLVLFSCREQAAPVEYDTPVVNFPSEETVVDAVVGQAVTFKAEIISGYKVSCTWSIDGVVEAASENFTYIFSEPGSYDVAFEAHNGGGKVERHYTAIVTDDFKMHLSVLDSAEITRLQLSNLNVAAIVDVGSDVEHSWTLVPSEPVGSEPLLIGEDAFCGYFLENTGHYVVSYTGSNSSGSYSRSFAVNVVERPLELSYSIYDDAFSVSKGEKVSISVTALFGGTGLTHKWTVNGEDAGAGDTLDWSADEGGLYVIEYHGENARGETAGRSWSVTVISLEFMFDDFEEGDKLQSWWTLAQNTPGIELVDNPDRSGINTSAKCMKDSVTGTGGTSGYFDLKGAQIKKAGIDLTKYNTIRMKVYLGKNRYYPRIQFNGTKYPPVNPPKFTGGWEELVFKFPDKFSEEQNFTFRPLLQENGSNIASGAVTETNTRCVYIDDIEFLD